MTGEIKKKLPGHLGGHGWKTHLDHGLIDYVLENYQPTSCLDIGCGPGGMVDLMHDKGLRSFGIDGDFLLERKNPKRFLLHDFTTGVAPLDQKYDWGYSCEFLEHVEAQYIKNFMPSFQKCRFVTVTHATPGMAGYHHVNLRELQYCIDVFSEWGFKYDPEETQHIRNISTMNLDLKPHQRFFKNTGIFFTNTKF